MSLCGLNLIGPQQILQSGNINKATFLPSSHAKIGLTSEDQNLVQDLQNVQRQIGSWLLIYF